MKNKSFLIISIIVISFLGVHCSQSPLSPNDAFNQAQLNGTVVLSGTSTVSLGAIQIGVKGTSLYTNPDGNGNFLIENIPAGNIVVEVSVQSDLSDIPFDNVQSGEEIKITVEVQANNQAVLANMERNNKSVELLKVEIRPDKWNIAWVDSIDEVTARITGEDFDDIDTAMPILMSGSVGSPISPISTEFGGFFFNAKFSQSQAIALVPNPPQQNSYDITVSFYLTDGTQHVLSCSVPIKAM